MKKTKIFFSKKSFENGDLTYANPLLEVTEEGDVVAKVGVVELEEIIVILDST